MTKLLTTQQAADYLKVDVSTIRYWTIHGKLKADKPSARIRLYRRADLDKIKLGNGGRGKTKDSVNSPD